MSKCNECKHQEACIGPIGLTGRCPTSVDPDKIDPIYKHRAKHAFEPKDGE